MPKEFITHRTSRRQLFASFLNTKRKKHFSSLDVILLSRAN